MKKYRPFVLPVAIVLGLVLHNLCAMVSFLVPYVIFSILILTFSSMELRKLRFGMLDLWLSVAQVALAGGIYFIVSLFPVMKAVPQGLMMCALCPVASSVSVVACVLGANRNNTIGFTICGNLLVSVVAPIFFVIMDGSMSGETLTTSFFAIFGKVATIIGLPFFVMLFIQMWIKPLGARISKYSGWAFYLWAVALLFTLGETIDYIYLYGQGNWGVIAILGVGSAIICVLQFRLGRYIGSRYNDFVGGQQLLGQKNSAMGIWMANAYMVPLSSVSMAFYSICQNLWNSWQLWRHDHKPGSEVIIDRHGEKGES